MCSYQPGFVLATERLTLRAPRLDDVDAIARHCADPDIARMTSRMPFPNPPEAIADFLARHAEEGERVFAIETARDGLIGVIGLSPGPRAPEVGYWLGKPHWGKGYATEAVKAVLAHVRDDWRQKVVVAGHFADNPASAAVLIKAGFLYTGDVERRFSLARG